MKKRLSYLLAACLALAAIGYFAIAWQPHTGGKFRAVESRQTKTCPFCNPAILDAQHIAENDLAWIILNYTPLLEGHSLVLPKRHVERYEELTEEEILACHLLLRQLQSAFVQVYDTADFFLALQNGKKGGQTVNHTHFHLIPRKSNSLYTKVHVWGVFLKSWSGTRHPLTDEQLQETIAPLKAALANPT